MLKTLLKGNPFVRKIVYSFLLWFRDNKIEQTGKNNQLECQEAQLERCTIRIQGSNNRLYFAPGCSVKDCQIEIFGNNHSLEINEGVILTQSILWFEDHDGLISLGKGTTMQRFGHIAVTEPFRKIEIGENCMFSFQVDIRNGDSHTIYNSDTKERVNWAKDIKIGDHVWLGAYTQIIGGADVGSNSIVGIRSLVNGTIAPESIAVGSPARGIKKGFNWDSKRWLTGDPYLPK
jgi:acetyltransferase-like isoleucine patch superfamily enzyme